MTDPRITTRRMHHGYVVERHLYADRLEFLPAAFWVARSLDGSPFHNGHGRTPDAAVSDMIGKQLRKAA